MSESTIIQNDKQHVWHHLTQHKAFESSDPLVVSKGKGMYVTDTKGDEYLDATSGGVWTVNLGYGRDEMVDTISNQLSKIPYFAGAIGNEPAAQYAKELTSIMPGLDRVYYSNSGSELMKKATKWYDKLPIFIMKEKNTKLYTVTGTTMEQRLEQ